jgi:hypothetical protein
MDERWSTLSRRKWPALAIGLTVSLALVVGLAMVAGRARPGSRRVAAANGGEEPGGSGSLEIEGITIINALNSDSKVAARATASWSGSEFPGVRTCTFIARDGSGVEVGRLEDIVASLSPSAGFSFRMEASSPATSVEAQCGARLDAGSPYRYDISDVRITGEEIVTITFDASWAGPGQAGAVTCRLDVLNQANSIVGSEEFTLFILMGSRSDLDRTLDVQGTATSADFDCSPFSG